MLLLPIFSVAALMALQPDPTRASRDAYNRCLFAFVDKAVQDRATPADFDTQFTQQCQTEEAAFRTAIRASLRSARMPAAEVTEMENMEVEDAHLNAKGRFEMAQPQT